MSECRRYMDDYPGARAECARNIAAGKLCHDCPKQPDSKESLLSENTALRAERDALVRERDEARDELLLTTRLDAELAMQRRAERAEADLAAARADGERYRFLAGDAPPHSTRWPRWDVRYWDGCAWQPFRRFQHEPLIDAAIAEDAAIASSRKESEG